jgi:hypothetical protein
LLRKTAGQARWRLGTGDRRSLSRRRTVQSRQRQAAQPRTICDGRTHVRAALYSLPWWQHAAIQRGPQKAIIAVAASILSIACYVLRNQVPHRDRRALYFTRADHSAHRKRSGGGSQGLAGRG